MARFVTGLFGSTKTSSPPATSMRVNTALQGVPIALLLGGRNRLAGNLIDYFGFNYQNAQGSGSAKGGVFGGSGGGTGSSTTYNYYASFLVGICEGPVSALSTIYVSGTAIGTLNTLNIWPSQIEIVTPSISPGYVFTDYEVFSGSYTQGVWPVTEVQQANHALNYRGICYAAFDNFPLGTSPQVPNVTFELTAVNSGALPGQPDGDPSIVFSDFLTNAFWGVGFPEDRLGDLTTWRQYCIALGMVVSPVLASSTAASQFLMSLCEATNSAPCWQDGQLTVEPYGDEAVTAGSVQQITETHVVETGGYPSITVGNFATFAGDGGVTYFSGQVLQAVGVYDLDPFGNGFPRVGQYYEKGGIYYFNPSDVNQEVLITYEYAATASYIPDTAPIYDFTVDDFLLNQSTIGQGAAQASSPLLTVVVSRDQMNNVVKVEYLDRSNSYNPVDIEVKDEASIDAFGRWRPSDVKQYHFFCLGSAAQQSANLLLIRQEIARTFQFTVGRHFMLILELMAIATVTDEGQGLFRQAVRITEIQENSDASITITAEEFLGTVSAPQYGLEAAAGFAINYNVDPGAANVPIIFEPTDELGQTMVSGGGLIVAGAVSGANPMLWGGAYIWASYDGINYSRVGQVVGKARMGALTSPLPSVPANPTGLTIDTGNVLSVSVGESGSTLATATELDATSFNTRSYVGGEIISYATAQLAGPGGAYNLTYLVRGCYGTEDAIATWPTGTPFARLDDNIFAFPYDANRIGSTIYIKIQGFNIYQGGLQNLAAVPAHTFLLTGVALASPLPTLQNLRTYFANGFTQLTWDEVSDFRPVRYEIRTGTSPAAAATLGTVAHPPYTIPGDGTYWVAAVTTPVAGIIAYSEEWVSATVSGAVITTNVILKYDLKANGWPGNFTGGAGIDTNLNAIRTGGGNILVDPNILATPDILNYGGGQSGEYFPLNVFIDLGYVTTPSVAIQYQPAGVPLGQNILAMGSILGVTDILGASSSRFITVYPLINTATTQGDLYTLGDLYQAQYVDLYAAAAGFGGFQEFAPGQYLARYLNFAMFLGTSDPNTIAYCLSFVITVTIPARIDQYSLVTSASGATTITFIPQGASATAPFNGGAGAGNLPIVQGTIINAQASDLLVISSLTDTSMSVEVTNGGSPVARTVYLTVEGF